MIRKYWFELFHFALWILVSGLPFFQQLIAQSHHVQITDMGGHWFWVEQVFQDPRPRG